MLVDAILSLKIENTIDTKTLRYARETAGVIFRFYTKINPTLVQSRIGKDENQNYAIKFVFLDDRGIIEVEQRYLSLVAKEINIVSFSLFEEAYVTSDPLIYKTEYYKNGSVVNDYIWGYTIPSPRISLYLPNENKSLSSSTDGVINNIRNNILVLLDEGYIALPNIQGITDIVRKKFGQSDGYEEIENVAIIKNTDKDRYQIEQSLL